MKPGWKSSECWHTAIAQGLALCTVFGLVNTNDSKSLEEAITKCVMAVFALCANGYIVMNYIKGRLHLKSLDMQPWEPNDRVKVAGKVTVPFWIIGSTAFLLCLFGSDAQAQSVFPWRNNISQRISQHENDIRELRNKPAPQAPAPGPQYIVLAPQFPPAQSFPIQGQPIQSYPIEGKPRQDFPIQGQPRQDFPVEGQPKQMLPIEGKPIQQLPIQGNPQKLPIAPQGAPIMPPAPALGGPQQYTIQRALWRVDE